jgi:hypothetical protein
VDLDTFATYVYVIVDECCKECFGPERHPGPAATLSRSEVLTLALIEQWGDFAHERAFWEAVEQHLRPAFPALVDRTDFNRQLRGYRLELARLSLALGEEIATTPSSYQVMDSVDVAVRNVKRRGASWFDGQAGVGWSNRLGWFFGFRVLTVCTPEGIVTGYGIAPGDTNDRVLAESLLAARADPHPRLPSAGAWSAVPYLADANVAGIRWVPRWQEAYHATVLAPPQRDHLPRWSKARRRWHASHRQIIESVHHFLVDRCRLETDRRHSLQGFWAALAAKIGLYHVCLRINQLLDRPLLSYAKLLTI